MSIIEHQQPLPDQESNNEILTDYSNFWNIALIGLP